MIALGRRAALLGGAGLAIASVQRGRAAEQVLTIGMSVPLTGALARQSHVVRTGAQFAVDQANAKGGIAGHRIQLMVLDDGSPTTGQYDPALSATNARRMLNDPTVIASVGPLNSGSAKAMAPIFSEGQMAFISGSATNPDLNDPKFFALYHPGGKPNFFRTVTTDAYQGPGMANYFAEVLKVKKLIVLDDTGAYGVGMANAFAGQAVKKGMDVAVRDRVDPLNADYSPVLTRAKSIGCDALYYGGDPLAGTKVVKQSYEIMPNIPKAGGDGVHTPDMLTGGGFPAVNGWYAQLRRLPRIERTESTGLGEGVPRCDEDRAGRLFRDLLRRHRGHPGCDPTGRRLRQAGHARFGARGDAEHASGRDTGRDFIRQKRRPRFDRRVDFPGEAEPELPGGRRGTSVHVYRACAGILMPPLDSRPAIP